MLSVCDLGVNPETKKVEVVSQRDWEVPSFLPLDIVMLCTYTKSGRRCDGVCGCCIITRIQNLSDTEKTLRVKPEDNPIT